MNYVRCAKCQSVFEETDQIKHKTRCPKECGGWLWTLRTSVNPVQLADDKVKKPTRSEIATDAWYDQERDLSYCQEPKYNIRLSNGFEMLAHHFER